MSKVFFISDLHLGHKQILDFSPSRGGHDAKSHAEWLVKQWNSVVTKRDLVYVLGDVCFDKKYLPYLKQMNGTKHLIFGNHDQFPLDTYLKYFNKVHGFMKYKGIWLSHAPIHPNHLRDRFNIHGHLHNNIVMAGDCVDGNYFNVSIEMSDGIPTLFEDIRWYFNLGDVI